MIQTGIGRFFGAYKTKDTEISAVDLNSPGMSIYLIPAFGFFTVLEIAYVKYTAEETSMARNTGLVACWNGNSQDSSNSRRCQGNDVGQMYTGCSCGYCLF